MHDVLQEGNERKYKQGCFVLAPKCTSAMHVCTLKDAFNWKNASKHFLSGNGIPFASSLRAEPTLTQVGKYIVHEDPKTRLVCYLLHAFGMREGSFDPESGPNCVWCSLGGPRSFWCDASTHSPSPYSENQKNQKKTPQFCSLDIWGSAHTDATSQQFPICCHSQEVLLIQIRNFEFWPLSRK